MPDLNLAGAAQRLAAAGVLNPRREARHILAAVRGTSPGAVWLETDVALPDRDLERFQEAVERRAAGAPFAYATGIAGFRSLVLRVDRRALIPRPETEGLVDLALAHVGPGGRAADIGTGTGCIALSLAVEGRFQRIVAVEPDPDTVALARENVALIAPQVPVEVRQGSGLAPLRERGREERFKLIVSNPPYLTEDEYQALDPMVRDYEPRQALVSGVDGLDATRELLACAGQVLEMGGLLALEIDERRADTVRDLARAAGWRVRIHEDLFGKPRYALAGRREDVC